MGAHLTFQVCIRMITFIPQWNYCFDEPQKCIRMITFIPQCNHCADVRQIRFGRVLVSRQSLNRRSPLRLNEISVGKTFILEIFIPQSSSFIRGSTFILNIVIPQSLSTKATNCTSTKKLSILNRHTTLLISMPTPLTKDISTSRIQNS